MWTVRCGKAKGESEQSQVEKGEAIAYQSEGQHIALCVVNKDTHKTQVEDHSLHQHPHETDKERIVDHYCNNLAMNGWTSRACFVYASYKDELSYAQGYA